MNQPSKIFRGFAAGTPNSGFSYPFFPDSFFFPIKKRRFDPRGAPLSYFAVQGSPPYTAIGHSPGTDFWLSHIVGRGGGVRMKDPGLTFGGTAPCLQELHDQLQAIRDPTFQEMEGVSVPASLDMEWTTAPARSYQNGSHPATFPK